MDVTEITPEESTPLIFVDFAIRGTQLDVVEITRLMGIQPSWKRQRGDQRPSRSGKIVTETTTIWGIQSVPTVSSADVNEHASYLLSLLEPRLSVIRSLRTRSDYSSVYIRYMVNNLVASFGINGNLLSRLATFGDEVAFSIITHDPGQGVPDWSFSEFAAPAKA